MKIISCKVTCFNGLDFSKIDLQEVNLIVGQSASGKTKFLNTLWDIARFALGSQPCPTSMLEIEIEYNHCRYRWECESQSSPEQGNIITKEKIEVTDKKGEKTLLIDRSTDNFKFAGNTVPKLSSTSSSIFLFKEEASIQPLHFGWSQVFRRDFSAATEPELRNASGYSVIPANVEKLLKDKKSLAAGLYQLFNYNLNIRLYLLNQYSPEKYKEIINIYRSIFPFIKDCSLSDTGKAKIPTPSLAPVFAIQEANVNKNLSLHELSSGMIKVLLIVTDILTLPENAIYLLDEYENSLGINAIDFLPPILLEHQENKQFLITSHHPYLINKMPISNWYIFSRDGSKVDIKFGQELVNRYKHSHQEAFIQLINDPFYNAEN
jgi:AAA15 family ATPase/GTPase